jgi:signal transduction histidine kinase
LDTCQPTGAAGAGQGRAAPSAAIRLSREPLDLGQLARDVASSLGILAEERNQKLALDVSNGVLMPVDRVVVREAVTNLLDNGIKYSPVGSTVEIHVHRRGGQAVLAIANEGPGIATEHRERIFHRFFRVDQARSRDGGGAGPGLAIAKWAVDMHGGQITVDERPGGGSEFRILPPLAQTAPATGIRDQHGFALEDSHETIVHRVWGIRGTDGRTADVGAGGAC